MTSLDLCFSLKIRSKDSYLALDKNRTKLYKKILQIDLLGFKQSPNYFSIYK
jgi:hypothetical protein